MCQSETLSNIQYDMLTQVVNYVSVFIQYVHTMCLTLLLVCPYLIIQHSCRPFKYTPHILITCPYLYMSPYYACLNTHILCRWHTHTLKPHVGFETQFAGWPSLSHTLWRALNGKLTDCKHAASSLSFYVLGINHSFFCSISLSLSLSSFLTLLFPYTPFTSFFPLYPHPFIPFPLSPTLPFPGVFFKQCVLHVRLVTGCTEGHH